MYVHMYISSLNYIKRLASAIICLLTDFYLYKLNDSNLNHVARTIVQVYVQPNNLNTYVTNLYATVHVYVNMYACVHVSKADPFNAS